VIQIGEVGKAGEKIDQRIEFVKSDNDKRNKLLNLLYSGIAPPIIVFANQKKNCDAISKAINKAGVRSLRAPHRSHCTRALTSPFVSILQFRSATLHSGKGQDLRGEALDGFKAGTIDILVRTRSLSLSLLLARPYVRGCSSGESVRGARCCCCAGVDGRGESRYRREGRDARDQL
jgi:superfamily II DNA/RNA helicase